MHKFYQGLLVVTNALETGVHCRKADPTLKTTKNKELIVYFRCLEG